MTAKELCAVQDPLKAQYAARPETALARLTATAVLGRDITCTNTIGSVPIRTGMHQGVGGDPANLCPATILLDSLAACSGIVLGAVATDMGIAIRSGTVRVDGEIDLRGTLGVGEGVPVGFKTVRIAVGLDTDASPQQVDLLLKAAERYCVVYQTLTNPPLVTITLSTIRKS